MSESDTSSLDGLCLAGLSRALDQETQLFDRQIRDGRWARTSMPEAITGTAICLIGLSRTGKSLAALDPTRSLDAVVDLIRRQRARGAIGLAIWASALLEGPSLDEIERRCAVGPLSALPESLTTMELAWLITGLLHEGRRGGGSNPLSEVIEPALDELVARQAPSGLLAHAGGRRVGLRQRLRAGIANFADQIYAVQALALGVRALEAGRLLAPVVRLADRLTELQGPAGQWWWHYHAGRGVVVSRYPVYSVHQHAMAPMAFTALSAVTDDRWSLAVERGLGWLWDNEVGASMVDPSVPTIWRSVEPDERPAVRWWRRLRYVVNAAPDSGAGRRLTLNRETRPYEWAWHLYATAPSEPGGPGRHIV